MPQFETTRRIAHTPDKMFALVADIEKYPEFLPLCTGLTVRTRREAANHPRSATRPPAKRSKSRQAMRGVLASNRARRWAPAQSKRTVGWAFTVMPINSNSSRPRAREPRSGRPGRTRAGAAGSGNRSLVPPRASAVAPRPIPGRVQPPLGAVRFMEFGRAAEIVEIGYRSTLQALERFELAASG